MKGWGGGLIALGAAIVVVAFGMGNTVTTHVPDPAYTYSVIMKEVETVNLAKLQMQTMVFQIGLATALIGGMLLAAGLVAERPGEAPDHAPEAATSEAQSGASPHSPEAEEEQRRQDQAALLMTGGIVLALIVGLLIIGVTASSRQSVDSPTIGNAAADAEANAAMYEEMAENSLARTERRH